ncbi:m-AAA protease-interacting protein 1, mitochondrial [Toxorhynchites rutilus septentrionalis]|uniref:m-AAA protease-interacting protein 1, mitochondrial n=1 Tax=Toxorhynchites rutilus septentrionalis TaxID=329112 RepID=UPI0024797A82|nr:m-AAA protease-interacting protein 1, mitochondrial [Toxorhynchites rutilus septentrionalis]
MRVTMLLPKRAQNICQISRHLYGSVSKPPPNYASTTSDFLPTKCVSAALNLHLQLTPKAGNNEYYGRRCFSSGNENRTTPQRPRSLPKLMEFPEIVWPSVTKSIKNWIMVHFIIRPYFDHEYNLQDFVQGAKQALQVISSSLAGGEYKNLEGLVDRLAINDLKHSVGKMSVAQRYDLMVNKEDIYFSFPYEVGIMFDDEDASQKRFVEITMVFHVLKGLKEMVERGEPIPLNIGIMPEFRDKISICNYRFIKEFTKGVESDWTVNIVSHFKPNDISEE